MSWKHFSKQYILTKRISADVSNISRKQKKSTSTRYCLHKIECIISVSFYRKLPPPHGGADPGKVGVDGSLEKDINLQIAGKLAGFLRAADVEVVLTRESDAGLYDENVPNKKVQDMKNRVALIEEKKPALTVSIHQNSYHEEYVHGAQVFYFEGSEESKELAERIQRELTEQIDPDNARQAKANDSYYLLKKTSSPIVIVECGFLSNYEEAQKLSEELYQEKTAWAIHLAVMAYLNAAK